MNTSFLRRVLSPRVLTLSFLLSGTLVCQTPTQVAVPLALQYAPGNGALSLPARWNQGLMQSLLVGTAVPKSLTKAPLKRLRWRRPAFHDEPAYPAITRTLQLALASTSMPLNKLGQDMEANRQELANILKAYDPKTAKNPQPTALTTVFASRQVSLPATRPPTAGEAVGQVLINLPFQQPFVFQGPDLFVECQASSSNPLRVDKHYWVDAVYLPAGDRGLVTPIGAGGCGSVTPGPAMLLEPRDDAAPLGGKLRLRLTGGLPKAVVYGAAGRDPETQPTFGRDLAFVGAPGCYQWAWFELVQTLPNKTDAFGNANFDFDIPGSRFLSGIRFGLQVAIADANANPLGLGVSNGVMISLGSLGIGGRVATVLAPTQTGNPARWRSPWPAFLDTVPVLQFEQ